jgi:sphinganine-1-phosphate aldolase
MLRIPALKRKVKTELDAAQAGIEAKLVVRPPPGLRVSETNHALPQHGKDRDWVIGALQELQRLETGKGAEEDGEQVWRSGRISGAVYHGGDEMSEVITQAIGRFILTNPVSGARCAAKGRPVRRMPTCPDIVFAAAPRRVPGRAPHGV